MNERIMLAKVLYWVACHPLPWVDHRVHDLRELVHRWYCDLIAAEVKLRKGDLDEQGR